MMKRILALLLVIVMLFSLTACGGAGGKEDPDSQNTEDIGGKEEGTEAADNEDGTVNTDASSDPVDSDDIEKPSDSTAADDKDAPSGSADTGSGEKPSGSTAAEDQAKPSDSEKGEEKEEAPVGTETEDGKNSETESPVILAPSVASNTMGETLWNTFCTTLKETPEISMEELADALLKNPAIQFAGMTSPVEVGTEYYTGFGEYQITGYDSAAVYMPMIGSIAFVGYVFDVAEGTDVGEFVKSLTEHCDPRWNICVEAEQTVAGAVGDKVFFVMCPSAI